MATKLMTTDVTPVCAKNQLNAQTCSVLCTVSMATGLMKMDARPACVWQNQLNAQRCSVTCGVNMAMTETMMDVESVLVSIQSSARRSDVAWHVHLDSRETRMAVKFANVMSRQLSILASVQSKCCQKAVLAFVPRCVAVTETVPPMRSVAPMDVDMCVW